MKFNFKNKNNRESLKNINFFILKKLFFFISIVYLIYCLKININNISLGIDVAAFKFHIILSFVFCILSIFFNAYAWANITSWLGYKGSINNLVSFYILTNSLKYIPGGIWHFYERFNYLKNRTNKYISFYSILLEPYIMLTCSLLIASFGIYYSPIFIIFLIPAIFLNEKLIYYILFKLEIIKKKSINLFKTPNSKLELYSKIKLQSFFPIKSLIIELLFICSKFSSFIICFSIFNQNNVQNNLVLLIVFCLSWSIGLIVPAAPGGLGVFEASFIFFMSEDIPQSSTIEGLIYFRLISTISDLIFSAPFLIKRTLKKS